MVAKPALAPYTKWDDDSEDEDEEPAETAYIPPPSQDEIIGDSCLVLSGIPAEMTEMARSNIVRLYLDKGATVRWVSGQECLIAFKSDRVAAGAIPPMGASIFRVVRLRDAPLSSRTAYIEGKLYMQPHRYERCLSRPMIMHVICHSLRNKHAPAAVRDLYVVTKPERDSTVANRLIGAALGIRLPAPAKSAVVEARKARAPSPPRVDAWDD
jgi:hypothetical protein